MGAQVSDVQLSKILKYVESGKSQGATVVTGGARADGKVTLSNQLFSLMSRKIWILSEKRSLVQLSL